MSKPWSDGFFGSGTPQVVIYGPVHDGPRLFTASDPWVEPNSQPSYHNLTFPEGATWTWHTAMQLHPDWEFEAILCDYAGDAKRVPDPIEEAPEHFRAMIAECPERYRARAILSTAKHYNVTPGVAVKVN